MKPKKILIAFVAIITMAVLLPVESGATPPPWAPAHGYRTNTRQIYFPQQNMYYDLNRGTYLYLSGKNWTASVALPAMYSRVNLRVMPQIQLSVNSDRPYVYNQHHRERYWNAKAQRDYYKSIKKYEHDQYKEHKSYHKEMKKAQKEYEKDRRKAAKRYYKKSRD